MPILVIVLIFAFRLEIYAMKCHFTENMTMALQHWQNAGRIFHANTAKMPTKAVLILYCVIK